MSKKQKKINNDNLNKSSNNNTTNIKLKSNSKIKLNNKFALINNSESNSESNSYSNTKSNSDSNTKSLKSSQNLEKINLNNKSDNNSIVLEINDILINTPYNIKDNFKSKNALNSLYYISNIIKNNSNNFDNVKLNNNLESESNSDSNNILIKNKL